MVKDLNESHESDRNFENRGIRRYRGIFDSICDPDVKHEALRMYYSWVKRKETFGTI